MRRTLGTLTLAAALLAGALTGCGSDTTGPGGSADDTEPSSTPSSSTPTTAPTTDGSPDASPDSGDGSLVGIVSGTAAGGTTATEAVALPDQAAVDAFVGQFEGSLPGDLRAGIAGAAVSGTSMLYAAVVSVGCDVPSDVTITQQGSSVQVVAAKVEDPLQECFAPVTSVALVVVGGGGASTGPLEQ